MTKAISLASRAEWTVKDLSVDTGWIFPLDDRARRDLMAAIRKARVPEKSLLDYRRADFDLGSARAPILAAFDEVKRGRGIALVRGLPRDGVDEKEFELLTWAIGLHVGVARPQGKASHYISAVRDVGTVYRSSTGRGYSSNADLDFHTDGCDVVALSCYNQARSGGMSMITSSVTAHHRMVAERPDLAEILHAPFYFSRQAEEAPDEAAFYPNPIYAEMDRNRCSKWNRNRINSAQRMAGVPPLTTRQREAMDLLDEILRRPELMYTMYLRPGDMQILNSHVTLHSRTEFEDFDVPEQKRLLFRLWLAPADGPPLPESWRPFFRSVEAGTVRGGIRGQQYDERCRAFEARQAADLGMQPGV